MQRLIRFVGGPWHNRIECVELAPKVALVSSEGVPAGVTKYFHTALYHLAEYTSARYHTTYYQYVHGSLIRNHTAHRCTYVERLKPWKISRSELDERIMRALCSTQISQHLPGQS